MPSASKTAMALRCPVNACMRIDMTTANGSFSHRLQLEGLYQHTRSGKKLRAESSSSGWRYTAHMRGVR